MVFLHKPILIRNAEIFLEKKGKIRGSIYIENGKINRIYFDKEAPNQLNKNVHILDGTGLTVIPGFIDIHIHGTNGADTMDATEEALDTIAGALPKEGTTSFLATTITQSDKNIEKALMNIARYKNKPGYAEILGVHLEGPFIEKSKAGAQPLQYIVKPDMDLFKRWQTLSGHRIRVITLAPEQDPDGTFIETLVKNGVKVSAGHTETDFIGMKKAVDKGVTQLTHLCNAMNGIHHRDVGPLGAAFLLENLQVELIADGIHVVPEMLQIIFNNIGSDRIILITDAMRAKGLPDGTYELGGRPVEVHNNRACLKDGTLAGSILKMCDAVRTMLDLEGVSLDDIVKMASINPAKQIGVYNRKGSIAVGKDADLLLVDDDLTIKYTLCRGEIAYRGEI